MAGGWAGANAWNFIEPCDVCGTTDSERRLFHGGPAGPGAEDGHILVCEKCAEELDDEWHGCGCGG